ncbi:serine/threonine-protein kinase [Streptosporangium roseum]|uniref:serine/threonine-protein kinase n=1 Tax=Streptosporangium roseum TaxID=2001 RepID=UPI00332900C3
MAGRVHGAVPEFPHPGRGPETARHLENPIPGNRLAIYYGQLSWPGVNAYGLPPVLPLHDGDPVELSQYRVVGRLGQGGMGTVYLGMGPSGPVAIKMIKRHLATDAEFAVRFRREVASARRVHRFCTAPVLDAQLETEPFWVVTEYVPGPDLARVLREQGPLTGSNVEALAVGVATALTAIHGAGVVHRDLKPANVLLSPFGPRVIDFGIARAFDTSDGRPTTGMLLGTPEYMAPELVSGGAVGPASDVFAWGCVVFAAASGRSPFASKTVAEALFRVVNDRPALDPVDPALRETVAAALEKDPADRPTAQELLTRLTGKRDADAQAVSGAIKLDLTDLVRTAEPARPRPVRRFLAGAAAVAAALVVAVVAVLYGISETPPTPERILYSDAFDNKESGWIDNYTGAGRFLVGVDSDEVRWASAPLRTDLDLLLVESTFSLSGDADARGGIFCDFSPEDGSRYGLMVTRNGHARITEFAISSSTSLTADTPIPGFDAGNVRFQAECTREDRQIRLAIWVGGRKIVDAVDGHAPDATARPEVGLMAGRGPAGVDRTEASFEDFTVGSL